MTGPDDTPLNLALVMLKEALSKPDVVHLNMLKGSIAKPSLAQIAHIYGDEWTAALSAEYARGLRDAAEVADRHELACAKWVLSGRGNPVASEACAEIYARILALIPLSPSPVDASRRADTGNKEPTND